MAVELTTLLVTILWFIYVGAGKGTQCKKIENTFGFTHLSAGELLREERAREGSQFGKLLKAIWDECVTSNKTLSQLVPFQITLNLLEKAMTKTRKVCRLLYILVALLLFQFRYVCVQNFIMQTWQLLQETGNNKFLIDGFPRNANNFDGWTRKMSKKVDFIFVLFLECSQEKCVERCLKRSRPDDNEERLQKRFITYMVDTMPIIDHFRSVAKIREINANECPDMVFKDIYAVLFQAQCENLF